MKQFLKILAAVICGLLIANLLTIAILSGAVSSFDMSTATIPAEGVLKIDMSHITLREQSTEDPFSSLNVNGPKTATIGLRKAIKAIDIAATDPAVQFVYLKTDGLQSGMATLRDFRQALARFRDSGKAVIAYIESPTTGSYYLASVADKVLMTSCQGANVQMTGIATRLIFLKDFLDQIGVKVQLIRHGKYKSAGEMYVRNSASRENLQQNCEMINAIWDVYGTEMAASREISLESLNAAIDGLALCLPEDFVSAGLVDSLVDRSALENILATCAFKQKFSQVQMIGFADYVADRVQPTLGTEGTIAVIYADGEIVEDQTDPENVDGDRFASIIEDVRADSSVRAVVLRVNSPGGSVLASEKIKRELDLLKAEKPVIASFGDYAASGGYWISNNCDCIFASPVTLTGSIGVFSMIPDLEDLAENKIKIHSTTVGSHSHGDLYSLMRPLDATELAYMQRSVEAIYDKFVNIVAEGRSLSPTYVDHIAQGRVWTGTDALRLGLVDKLGTLEDAIGYAAETLGDSDLDDWSIVEYPAEPGPLDSIMALFSEDTDLDYGVSVWTNWYEKALAGKSGRVFARMPLMEFSL